MSRIGKKGIQIPEKTEVNFASGTVTVKGPKGTLTRDFTGPVTIHIARYC